MNKKAQLSNLKAGLFVILLVTLVVAAGLMTAPGEDKITGMASGIKNERRN